MVVPSVGLDGQIAIAKSSVLVIGAGGIGSTVLLYLAGLYRCTTVMNSSNSGLDI